MLGLQACGGSSGKGGTAGSGPSGTTATTTQAPIGVDDTFAPDTATAGFDACERLHQAATANNVPLFVGFDPVYTLPFQHYVEFGCTVPVDDGRNLSLTVTSVAFGDPAAARQEMDDLGRAFGGIIVEDGLESLPEGSYVTTTAIGENPKIYVLLVPDPFAVAVNGGGTNTDLDLAKRIAAWIVRG